MKAKLTIIALFGLFLAPILIAVVLNSQWVDWRANPDRSHGELIEPVQPLGEFELADADGQNRRLSDFIGRWQLVHEIPGNCNEACQERVFMMRQIRTSQNRHIPDIGLVILADDTIPDEFRQRIEALDSSFVVFHEAAGRELSARFPGNDEGFFYILDPSGNIIERFENSADPTGIRKDLRRLLTWTVRE
ncbi:MAG: SCO family protein [Pseudomonadota bacterium]